MQTELTWLTRPTTTALCAAAALELGRVPADQPLVEALAPAAARLLECCQAAGADPTVLLSHLIPLSGDNVPPAALATTALVKTIGRQKGEQHIASLAEALRQLDAALAAARPKLADELLMRRDVIKEQWDARGPGFLATVRRLTDGAKRLTNATIVPERAEVLLTHPLLGGGGDSWILYNRVTLEAVLANPHAALTEVVRLGWLLSQLNLELPSISELIPPTRLPQIAPLAMLCVALQAAEEVELARA
ncbi:MAG: hypothetical protein K8T91_20400, partial [Planctomycetes bacterium]|nr:hypothetical protein [Planctomycetota bacterium]